jgi:hypothetical protein
VPPDQAMPGSSSKREQPLDILEEQDEVEESEKGSEYEVEEMEESEWKTPEEEMEESEWKTPEEEMEEQEQDEVCNPSLISYNVLRLNDMSVLHVWYDELRRHV